MRLEVLRDSEGTEGTEGTEGSEEILMMTSCILVYLLKTENKA